MNHKYNYPDLSKAKYICFDFETRDPELKEKGPSNYRGDGYIIGCGISTGDFSEYYNLGHLGSWDLNFDEDYCDTHNFHEDDRITKKKNREYIKSVLALPVDKIGANISYDYGWAKTEGMEVNGRLIDVQTAEALLNEYGHSYSLQALAEKYFGESKAYDGLQEYCDSKGWKGSPAAHFWKMPSHLLRAYGIQDVNLPYKIWEVQKPLIEAEGMPDLFNMECSLIKTMWKFRDNGILLDVKKRDENAAEVNRQIKDIDGRLKGVNVKSGKQLSAMFDKAGIKYPLTAKGNPSIDARFLTTNMDNHPLIKDVYMMRKCRTENANFLEGAFVEMLTPDNRLHGNFHNMKNDDYGTKSGRFSMSKPNLQQVPGARDPYFYKLSRELFIPEPGQLLIKIDYSQIEYRVLSHYAVGPGADRLKQSYKDNPYTDYHQEIVNMTGLPRSQAKTLNFGILYGMGTAKAADTLGVSLEEGRAVVRQYHQKAPYVKYTTNHIENIGKKRKWLRTILGRRIHVVEGVKTYSLPNRLIQGSAGDVMKAAIYEADRQRLFEILTPHLTVHDELVVSMPLTDDGVQAANKLKEVMETCVKLEVPVIADMEAGPTWYDVHEVTDEDGKPVPLTLEKARELVGKYKEEK